MMSFLNSYIFGARVFVWLYLFFTLLLCVLVIAIVFREIIKYKYYRVVSPERLIKLVIHYPNNYFNVFFRLVPVNNEYNISGQLYKHDSDIIIKNQDFFATFSKDKKLQFTHEGFIYDIDANNIEKQKWGRTAELHYFYNSASPIVFNYKSKDITINSNQLAELKENDLFTKLLSLKEEKMVFMLLIIFIVLNMILTIVVLLKQFGVFDKHA